MAGRENLLETLIGAAVLVGAGGFLTYAFGAAGRGGEGGGYEVTARFGQVGGLASGADVRVAGVKVGAVSSVELDPKTYLALARLELDRSVKLPSDSTAKITPDGLLGGSHVAIEPGGAPDDLRRGGEIINTQGAVDIFGMIGGMMRPSAAPGPNNAPPALPES